MKSMERYLYLGTIVLLAAGCLYLGLGRKPVADNSGALAEAMASQEQLQKQLAKADAENARLNLTLEEQQKKLSELTKPDAQGAGRPVVRIDPGDLRELQSQGLTDPVNQIVADLVARRDLMPIQGVLGGTMNFHPSDRWVVAKNWVLADFDDGHILGWGVFKYTVENGKITWTRLDWSRP